MWKGKPINLISAITILILIGIGIYFYSKTPRSQTAKTPFSVISENKSAISSEALPDLIISDFNWSPRVPTVKKGTPYMTFGFTVKNVGTALANSVTDTAFMLYKNKIAPENTFAGKIVGTGTFTLAPGESKTFELINIEISDVRAQAGAFNLIMVADAKDYFGRDHIRESNEDNNFLSKPFVVLGLPELPYIKDETPAYLRDATRMKNLMSLPIALAYYYAENGVYPSSLDTLRQALDSLTQFPKILISSFSLINFKEYSYATAKNKKSYHLGASLENSPSWLTVDADFNSQKAGWNGGFDGNDNKKCGERDTGISCFDILPETQ